ncbi:hypothetical protein Peur_052515 [Populus x canadensis]
MGCPSSLFLFFSSQLFPYLCISGPISNQPIEPPFTASHSQFIDNSASISNFKEETSKYCFFVTHDESRAIIWTANRNHPISYSYKLYLSTNGLAINTTDNSGTTTVVWSAQALSSSSQVSVMKLQDSGNLVLLYRNNVSSWESFDHPTDTGDYRLVVTGDDAVLKWNGMSYWKLSMEPKAFPDSNLPVSFLALNGTGLFLLGSDKSTILINLEFKSPSDDCQIPFICNKMGLCTSGRCPCPPNFHGDPFLKGGSTPRDASLALRSGILYGNSSGSCYVLGNHLGSIMAVSNSNRDRLGNMKTLVVSSMANPDANNQNEAKKFPIAGLVLLPSSGILLIIVIALGFIYWRRNKLSGTASHGDSSLSDLEIISIPGLPVRFNYEVLVAATENFRAQIGSGGFGTVYKGTLPDKTIVAVKKITNVGVQGKKEFCTEIAIYWKYSYVNLVKLKGFCTQGIQRFLHKIIHCDVKPEDILLHENLQFKISDFGLSKLLNPEQSSLFTTMRGTRGYLAPEWLSGITISDKAECV